MGEMGVGGGGRGGMGASNQFYPHKTSTLILIQYQITNKCSVRTDALYYIGVTSQ